MNNDAKTELEIESLKMDIDLRRKQLLWENPRNIAILVGATAAIIGALAGLIGYKIGATPPSPIVIQLQK